MSQAPFKVQVETRLKAQPDTMAILEDTPPVRVIRVATSKAVE